MMFEHFTADARGVVADAHKHAHRLGHRYIGCEHLLLALAATGTPAAAVLREHGITPERVEGETVRLIGPGAGAGLFGGLDRDALSAIGIDLDAVRARIEASFGPEALTQASHAVHCGPRCPRSVRFALSPGLVRRWRRRARRAVPVGPPSARRTHATGRYRAMGATGATPAAAVTPGATGTAPSGHLPFTPRAKKSLANSLR